MSVPEESQRPVDPASRGTAAAALIALLGMTAITLAACTNSESGLRYPNQLPTEVPPASLGPKQPAPTFDGGATTYIQDEVLITFRQVRTSGFQTTTLYWNGSVRNLGNVLRNARFEIVTTQGVVIRGEPQVKVEETQLFGDLQPGQEQQLRISFTFPNSHAQAISGRFAHD